jgi:hypothetical protein
MRAILGTLACKLFQVVRERRSQSRRGIGTLRRPRNGIRFACGSPIDVTRTAP